MIEGDVLSGTGGRIEWIHKLPRWHTSARIIAGLVLLDQALSITTIPSSEAIVVACIGALFAPIPTSRRED